MRPTKPFAAAIVATAVVCAAVTVFTQTMRVAGTKVSIAPPDGFSIAQQYPGFERQVDQASVMVTELPGAAADMIRGLTPQALATRGMTVIAAHDHVINGSPARLLNVRQKTGGGDVLKWMLIAGDRTLTIMIVGTFPSDAPASIGNAIRQSLLTTSWGTADPDEFEALPFQITATSRLKIARRVSNMIMLTESGTIGSPGSSEAIYLVGHSIGRGAIGDVRIFSEARARETTLTKDVGNFTGREVQVDRLSAYELEADAVDTRSGTPMRLYQVIVPDDTGYFILQGLSRADRAREMLAEFRAVTASFRRK